MCEWMGDSSNNVCVLLEELIISVANPERDTQTPGGPLRFRFWWVHPNTLSDVMPNAQPLLWDYENMNRARTRTRGQTRAIQYIWLKWREWNAVGEMCLPTEYQTDTKN